MLPFLLMVGIMASTCNYYDPAIGIYRDDDCAVMLPMHEGYMIVFIDKYAYTVDYCSDKDSDSDRTIYRTAWKRQGENAIVMGNGGAYRRSEYMVGAEGLIVTWTDDAPAWKTHGKKTKLLKRASSPPAYVYRIMEKIILGQLIFKPCASCPATDYVLLEL